MDSDFRDYVTARSATLLRTAYLLTGNHADAEDLLQDALFKLSIAWPRVHQSGSLDGYVRKTMVNLHISKWRRRKLNTTTVDRLPDVPSRDLATETFSVRDEIWRALATLPPRMRAALVLRFYEDMSETEIASTLGCAVGTVKSQTARGLAKLRETVPEWEHLMIDNELVATLRDRALTSLTPDTGRVLEAIEGRRVRRQRLRVAGAAIATLAVVGAVTGVTIGLHGSSTPPAPLPPAKHTSTAAPTVHTTIKVTSTVALNPGLSTSEATGGPIAAEAPDGTVYYAVGSQVTQVRTNGAAATFEDAGSPVIAIAATSSHVVVLAQKLVSDTSLNAHENSLSSTQNSNGPGVWPTPGASSTAPINDGGVAVEGDIAYVWDRHDDHGNPPATLSRINLSTGTLTTVDHWLTPGDVYADPNGIFYNNEANGTQLARVGPTGPPRLVPHHRDFGILGLDEGVLVGEYVDRNGSQPWYLVDAHTLKPLGAVRPQGTFGDRLTSTTPAILTLSSTYPCYGGTGSCEPTVIYALYREPSALVDSGSLNLPHIELLLSGGPPAAITGGSTQQLVRLSVSTPASVAIGGPDHTVQVP